MRSSLSTALIALLLPSVAVATAARSACLHLKGDDLAEAAACGEKVVLRNCFASVSGDVSQQNVEACFVKAGCTPSGAEYEAAWIVQFCDGEADELKRRRPEPIPGPTPEPVPMPQATTTAVAIQTTLQCSTQSMTEIETCASDNKFSCSKTSVPTMVCAAGLLCMIDKAGNSLCMKRQDNMTTSGAVIAVILAVILTAILGSIFILCCRDKRRAASNRRKAEAAAIAKANRIEASETQPLTQNQPNPFHDVNRAT